MDLRREVCWMFLIGAAGLFVFGHPFLCAAGNPLAEAQSTDNEAPAGMVFGAGLGAGLGAKIFGSEQAHNLSLAYVHCGRMITRVIGPGSWYEGRLAVWAELFSGAQFSPKTRYLTGLTLGPRYYFKRKGRWLPYVDGGVGLYGTDISEPDLSSTIEFNVQIGLGGYYMLTDRLGLNLQLRGFHLSNAGMELPNHGTNTFQFLIGLGWFF